MSVQDTLNPSARKLMDTLGNQLATKSLAELNHAQKRTAHKDGYRGSGSISKAPSKGKKPSTRT